MPAPLTTGGHCVVSRFTTRYAVAMPSPLPLRSNGDAARASLPGLLGARCTLPHHDVRRRPGLRVAGTRQRAVLARELDREVGGHQDVARVVARDVPEALVGELLERLREPALPARERPRAGREGGEDRGHAEEDVLLGLAGS